MDAVRFGRFIAECRKEGNMTQAELARRLNVTDKAVSRWERGVGFPNISTLEPLASALNISVLELMRSERISSTQVPKETAEEAFAGALDMAARQRRQERKNALRILGAAAVATVLILFLDSLRWRPAAVLFTTAGVVFPLFCTLGLLSLLACGIWRKATGRPSGRTFLYALVLLALLVMFILFFLLVGALGIWPAPN